MAKLLEKFLVLKLSKAVPNSSNETLSFPEGLEDTLGEVVGSILSESGLSGVVVEVEADTETD